MCLKGKIGRRESKLHPDRCECESRRSIQKSRIIPLITMMIAKPMMRGRWASINSTLFLRCSPSKRALSSLSSFSNRPKPSFFLGNQRKILIMSQSTSVAVGSGADHEIPLFKRPRFVVKMLLAESQKEGQGATVRRSIGRPELRNLDPFLMLDEFSVSHPAGFPDHPHRGFETVTYMLEGAFTHQDFAGHKGTISTGDVQWMTAGRGIIHSEMPAGEGVQKGLQLWINLSSKDKMVEPRYQELLSKNISRTEKDGVEARIIAGEAFGVQSPVYTRTPTMLLDFTMKPGAQLHQPIPDSWNSFVYIIEGEGIFGREDSAPVTSHHCLVLSPGDGIRVWNKAAKQLRFVLIAGQPLEEPVVQHGPFVMNTQAEIRQAMEDYHFGRNGFERAKHWQSEPLLH